MNAEQLVEYRRGLGIADALSVALADRTNATNSDPTTERENLRAVADHFARAAALHDPDGCWYCEQMIASQPRATRTERDDYVHVTAPCSASWYVPDPEAERLEREQAEWNRLHPTLPPRPSGDFPL